MATNVWRGGAGNYNTAGNWSLGHVPGSTDANGNIYEDDVSISAPNSNVADGHFDIQTVNTLTVAANTTFSENFGQFRFSAEGSINNGTINLTNASFGSSLSGNQNSSIDFTNNGIFNIDGGSDVTVEFDLLNSGTYNVLGSLDFATPSFFSYFTYVSGGGSIVIDRYTKGTLSYNQDFGNLDNTISGAGYITDRDPGPDPNGSPGYFENDFEGVVDASTGELTIDPLTGIVDNRGVLEATHASGSRAGALIVFTANDLASYGQGFLENQGSINAFDDAAVTINADVNRGDDANDGGGGTIGAYDEGTVTVNGSVDLSTVSATDQGSVTITGSVTDSTTVATDGGIVTLRGTVNGGTITSSAERNVQGAGVVNLYGATQGTTLDVDGVDKSSDQAQLYIYGTIGGGALESGDGGQIFSEGGTLDGTIAAVSVSAEIDVFQNGSQSGGYMSNSLTVKGTIENTSSIVLSGYNVDASLLIGAASATLASTGDVEMIGLYDVITASAQSDLLVNDGTIVGQGFIGGLLLDNEGTLDATNGSLLVRLGTGGANVNRGLIEATGGGDLEILASNLTNDGFVEAQAGSTITIGRGGSADLVGGVLGGQYWEAVGDGATLSFADKFTSDAAFKLVLDNSTSTGAGAVIMDGNATLQKVLTDIGSNGGLSVVGGAYTTTNALTVEGSLNLSLGATFTSGAISAAAGSTLAGGGTIRSKVVSHGTIEGDPNTDTGNGLSTLTFTGNDAFDGTFLGQGIALRNNTFSFNKGLVLGVENLTLGSATLSLMASQTYSGFTFRQKLYNAFAESSSTIAFASSGLSFTLLGTSKFLGGSVTGAGLLNLEGTATATSFGVTGGATLDVFSKMTVSGVIALGSVGAARATSGTVRIASGGSLILTTGSIVTTPGASGTIGNSGVLEKFSASTSTVAMASVVNRGTILAAKGTFDFNAAIGGTGKATIQGAAVLEFDKAVAATQAVSFGAGGGTLALNAATAFAGSIAALGAGDTIDIGHFGSGTTETYAANSQNTGGTLTLRNGNTTAHLTLTGDYSASGFHLSAGKSGDTLVTYAKPAQTNVAHAPSEGAHVSDFARLLFEAAFAPSMTNETHSTTTDLNSAPAMLSVPLSFGHR